MCIAFFNTNKIWGGGEQWHFNMLKGLKAKGNSVIGVTSKSPLYTKLQEEGIEIYRYKATAFSYVNPFEIFRLYKFYKKHNVKSVVFGIPHDLKVGGFAAKLAGVEKIIYARALAAPVKNGVLNRFLFSRIVTDVVANSQETMRMMLKHNASLIPNHKRHVIYYGLNLKAHDEKPFEIMPFRKEKKLIIGNAGRLTEQKGQLYLLNLAEEILKTGRTDFKIVIAGSGELEEKLKAQIKEKKLDKYIEILGFVDNVKSFMESIDVFVLTSLWEGFGFVIAEAFLSKKPVVAWDATSNPELIIDGENGYLIPEVDVAMMKDKVLELLDDEAKRALFGQAGKDRIVEEFSHQKELKAWSELLVS